MIGREFPLSDSTGGREVRSWSPGRVAALAAIICLATSIRALYCGFCPSDDYLYVTENPAIRSLDLHLVSWAFTTTHAGWWMPLVWLSLAGDYHFWQLNPFGYHLTNILLHATNVFLVVLVADSLLFSQSAVSEKLKSRALLYPATLLLAGLLFGIHPLRVEAVAWITSRKDLLNGLFTLGAILFYLRHVRSRATFLRGYGSRDYLLALLCFLFSLMAKPVSVVLPLLLLVIDWYPLGRFRQGGAGRIILEKVPFLLLSVAAAVFTLVAAASHGMLQSAAVLTPWQRLIVSGYAISEYVRYLLVPVGITPLHQMEFPLPAFYGVQAVIALLLCLLVIIARKRVWLPAACLWFILLLLPVLAFFQNGDQAYAARYTYLPAIAPGIVAAVICGLTYAGLAARSARVLLSTLLALYLLFLGGVSWHLAGVWDTSESYWSRVIAVQPLAKPYFKRAEYYAKSGRHAEAVRDYTAVLERASGEYLRYRYNIYAFRGESYRSLGKYAEAVRDLSAAIGMSPRRPYYHARGQALQSLGLESAAAADFRMAGDETGPIDSWYQEPALEELALRLEHNPADADALYLRGVARLRTRDYTRALADFNLAIRLQPTRAGYYWARSTLHLETAKPAEVLADCTLTLRFDNSHRGALLRRASILAQKEDYSGALADLQVLLRLDPASFAGYANRGLIHYRQGKLPEAIADFDSALRLDGSSAQTYYNRGLAFAAFGERERADADFLQARRLGYPGPAATLRSAGAVGKGK
jgi:tetratricopeptide (TPR) repeat protein